MTPNEKQLVSKELMFRLREALLDNLRKQIEMLSRGLGTSNPEFLRLAHDELVIRHTIIDLGATP
jgi:hypothetical protein